MADDLKLTHEKHLQEHLSSKIKAFWEHGEFNAFNGVDSISIHYAKFLHSPHLNITSNDNNLIIVPGRTESYLKYQELAYDFFQQGFNIFIIDHRGQGLSGRMLSNSHKGYVKNFQHYVDDLAAFVNNIVLPTADKKPYLLAHSMGGAIATRFMQQQPETIKASMLISPMLGFNTGIIPQSIAKFITKSLWRLNRIMTQEPWYFLGQSDYKATPFNKNILTHSKVRHKVANNVYNEHIKTKLGGVTAEWLMQCIKAQNDLFAELKLLTTPVALIQGGEERIVCQKAQNDFCKKLSILQPKSCLGGAPDRIEGAFHELLFEVDEIRDETIKKTLQWFKQNSV